MEATQQATDADLIRLFLEGQDHAFQRLSSRYSRRIYLKIFSIVKDHHLAEDLLQETFIRILSSLRAGRYTDDGRFGLWSLRIAHNLCMDHKRRLRRRPTLVLREEPESEHACMLLEESSEERYLRMQTSIHLQKLVNALPPEQREVVIYRHYEQMSFRQIALLTNSSINTTLGRMRYGIMNLRKLIKKERSISAQDLLLYQ